MMVGHAKIVGSNRGRGERQPIKDPFSFDGQRGEKTQPYSSITLEEKKHASRARGKTAC